MEFLDSVYKNCISDNDGKLDLLNECILLNVFGLIMFIVKNRVLGEKICFSDRGIYLVFWLESVFKDCIKLWKIRFIIWMLYIVRLFCLIVFFL